MPSRSSGKKSYDPDPKPTTVKKKRPVKSSLDGSAKRKPHGRTTAPKRGKK